jgi:polysaccharide biosynthesis protein PslH
MKKILWLSHLLPYPPKGGVLQRSYNLIKEASKNHKITLLAFNQGNLCKTRQEMDEGITHLRQYCDFVDLIEIESEKSKMAKLQLLLGGLLPGQTYTTDWLKSKKFNAVLEGTLASNEFDIIHIDTISLAPYVINLHQYKKVLNHHNIESLMLLRRAKNEKNIFKKIYFHWEGLKLKQYEKKHCNKFNLNITCSNLDSDRLIEHAPGITCIDIPNGVDLSYFKSANPTLLDRSIVFAGGLSWYPNHDAMTFFLKDVWPQLNIEVPDVKMTVIGRSPATWMIELQKQYPNLTVTGFVDDVRPYIDKAYLYVCPIRDGGGTKLKVLDALAMKKLLIAHPIACEGIAVVDGESVIFATTPEEYIVKIKESFANKTKSLEIAENGYQIIADQYDFIKIGEKLSLAYNSIND